MAEVLVLCHPSSELYIAEHFYRQTAMADLLGTAANEINEQRLYRALDQLLPHKAALEQHLKNRMGELFQLDYDLLEGASTHRRLSVRSLAIFGSSA